MIIYLKSTYLIQSVAELIKDQGTPIGINIFIDSKTLPTVLIVSVVTVVIAAGAVVVVFVMVVIKVEGGTREEPKIDD